MTDKVGTHIILADQKVPGLADSPFALRMIKDRGCVYVAKLAVYERTDGSHWARFTKRNGQRRVLTVVEKTHPRAETMAWFVEPEEDA